MNWFDINNIHEWIINTHIPVQAHNHEKENRSLVNLVDCNEKHL